MAASVATASSPSGSTTASNSTDGEFSNVKSGIADHVIFAGYQSNIPLIQSMFDIQVFPSLYEGTPLTMFEAMAMERAIVSTNVDGLGEMLRDDHNAMVVPPANAEALGAALDMVLSDAQRHARLAARAGGFGGVRRATNGGSYAGVYRELLADSPRTRHRAQPRVDVPLR